MRLPELKSSLPLAVIFALAALGLAQGQAGGGAAPNTAAKPMVLTSSAFADGAQIPTKYTAAYTTPSGDRVSPQLNWSNVPQNTASFVLHMHDIDAAINHTTEDSLHWLNIPASAKGLPEGVSQGAQLKDGSHQVSSKTQFDQRGYGYRAPGAAANGPMHHYVFELFALNSKVDVMPSDDAFEVRRKVMAAIQGHILAKAVYMGFYRLPPGVTPSLLK